MNASIRHDDEPRANADRERVDRLESRSQRTFTPTLAVIERSSGPYHFTSDDRRLIDFTSGVLVTNLGHHPQNWLKRFQTYLGLTELDRSTRANESAAEFEYASAPPWTTYNAVGSIELEACDRLIASVRRTKFGARLDKTLWSASGSEGVQKALWACLKRRPGRDVILATRHGFHGKKGLSEAVTGDERSENRDPRVKFISFPISLSSRVGPTTRRTSRSNQLFDH
jgi:4-aminobutyrate aminotransferase-like enzyme